MISSVAEGLEEAVLILVADVPAVEIDVVENTVFLLEIGWIGDVSIIDKDPICDSQSSPNLVTGCIRGYCGVEKDVALVEGVTGSMLAMAGREEVLEWEGVIRHCGENPTC